MKFGFHLPTYGTEYTEPGLNRTLVETAKVPQELRFDSIKG